MNHSQAEKFDKEFLGHNSLAAIHPLLSDRPSSINITYYFRPEKCGWSLIIPNCECITCPLTFVIQHSKLFVPHVYHVVM